MKTKLNIFFILIFILLGRSIFSQNITAVTENNLNFGDAYLGYSSTLNHTDAGAAKFVISQRASGNPFIAVDFVLPNSFINGAYNLPVIFGPATSAYSNVDSPSGRTNFNPNTTLTVRLQRNDRLYIWLGGIINVPTNVIPGVYSSTITLTVTIL